ncbi:MAG: hypothetical protein K9I26_07055 [Flavobacterium sp.]|nr:hypothetical protein [Flavobacterium sp.]
MQIKKYISVLLAVFILVSNIGLAFKVHYCMDSIASVSLAEIITLNSEENCCGVFEKKSSCCKDKVVHFQKKSEQKEVIPIDFLSDFTLLLEDWKPIFFSVTSNFKSQNSSSYYCDAHAPPLFKLYHQFIFYA